MNKPEIFTPDAVIINKETKYIAIPIKCRTCGQKGFFTGTHAEYLKIYSYCPMCHQDRCYADTDLIMELAQNQHKLDLTTFTRNRNQWTQLCRHYWIWQQTHRPINPLFMMEVQT